MRIVGFLSQVGTCLVYRYLMDTEETRTPPNVYLKGCASRTVLEVIANKWTHLVVCSLRTGPLRFGELRRHLEGITQKMLTQTLRALERDGLVSRTLYPTIPPRVDYELTELGRDAAGLFDGLITWAEQHAAEVTAAREHYDQRTDPEPVANP
jgi:DNA-binding HxlR family transcriptional regulator